MKCEGEWDVASNFSALQMKSRSCGPSHTTQGFRPVLCSSYHVFGYGMTGKGGLHELLLPSHSLWWVSTFPACGCVPKASGSSWRGLVWLRTSQCLTGSAGAHHSFSLVLSTVLLDNRALCISLASNGWCSHSMHFYSSPFLSFSHSLM